MENSDKLREKLGWSDQIELDRGLKGTLDWMMNNLDLLKTYSREYIHKI